MTKLNPIHTRLGLYEKAIHAQYDWTEKFQLAKAAGFDFIELSIDESAERLNRLNWKESQWLELLALSQKYQMPFRSLCLSAHRKYPLGSADETIRTRALKIFDQALVVCQILGIQIIQLAGYDVYYEPSTEDTKAWFLTNLKVISEKATAAGVLLGIETMDTPFLGTAENVRPYLQAVNNPYLKTYPDLGNLYQWSEDPVYDLSHNVADFVQIHIKATKPDTFRDLDWDQSTVDYQSLLSTLFDHHYDQYFVAELWATATDLNPTHQLATLKRAYQKVWGYLNAAKYLHQDQQEGE